MPLQATSGAASYDAFGGGVAAVPNYIEDVFSTYLYTGTDAAVTINNGIDLSTKGGMIWWKSRSNVSSNLVQDTARGITKVLRTNTTDAETTETDYVTSLSTTGFSVGASLSVSPRTYATWTFRKQPKFFDVVTYTGNGSARTIAHNLGSAPGCIMIKCLNDTFDWIVWHRSFSANNQNLFLNTTNAAGAYGVTSSTAPTDTVFSLINEPYTNQNGSTYVAYLFAHNAGGFGLTGTDNVISCGTYTGNGSATGPTVTLGYEPQWVLVKRTDSTSSWTLSDNMRGQPVDGATAILSPNLSDAEASATTAVSPTATGFQVKTSGATYNASGGTYIYIAIRRGPMKVPTSGTSVFDAEIWSGNTTTQSATRSIAGIGSPTDLFIGSERDPGFNQNYFYDRLRGTNSVGGLLLVSSTTDSETTNSPGYGQYSFAQQDGITLGNYTLNYTGRTYVGWQFKRAPSFMDVVCYSGTGSTRTVSHNLTVVPELMIVKARNDTRDWLVYCSGLTLNNFIKLNLGNAQSSSNYAFIFGNDTTGVAPTSSVFTVGSGSDTNGSGGTYVAYLFATCAGVSKVGSYTGTGSTQTINCGFTGGARFVLIKASSTTGDWYVWDTARGIVSGNDPYLWLNSPYASAEVTNTDWVDTASTGFELSNAGGNLANSNGVSYIFLAIA